MSRFFVPSENIFDDRIVIDGTDVNHIKNVLRHRVGDKLYVSDSSGVEYECIINNMSDGEVTLDIVNSKQSETELGMDVILFQGLPKKDKMELIVQKAVELGVTEIYPVINERTVVKLDDKKAGQKADRWNKISESAAKQSGRMIIPKVHEPVSYKKALEIAGGLEYVMIPYENADGVGYSAQCITEAVKTRSVGIFIGPEGGFSRDEVDKAVESGAKVISLGKRILRTETAGLTTLSIIMFEKEKQSGL
ncbi:MAG: 16S rRNA (uracil(1498)-N(3))-methyltransferase [Lachnospiraceae bacterium]|nr:16S rRNA (uracil(1498)-N(3))-methyltransferase [Lachnospiraceae bacterium]